MNKETIEFWARRIKGAKPVAIGFISGAGLAAFVSWLVIFVQYAACPDEVLDVSIGVSLEILPWYILGMTVAALVGGLLLALVGLPVAWVLVVGRWENQGRARVAWPALRLVLLWALKLVGLSGLAALPVSVGQTVIAYLLGFV